MRNRLRVNDLVEFRAPIKDLRKMKKIKKKLERDFYKKSKDSIEDLLKRTSSSQTNEKRLTN